VIKPIAIIELRLPEGISQLVSYSSHFVQNFLKFIYCFTAQVLKVCRTPGPIACSRNSVKCDQISKNPRPHATAFIKFQFLYLDNQRNGLSIRNTFETTTL